MHNPKATPVLSSAPITQDCGRGCGWQIVSDSATLAALELATHTVEAHATLSERRKLQALVDSYRPLLGALPANLLILAVRQVMDAPATATPAATDQIAQVAA